MPSLDLEALLARLPPRPLTRFAPSPTGHLHLGHVANAIHVWGIARALGGKVLLRLEDHDRSRCRPAFEASVLDDLEWLGLEPDVGSVEELRRSPSPYRQSDCGDVYEAALVRLTGAGGVFGCDCSRRDIAAEGGDPFNEETPYPGRCRELRFPPTPGRGVRVRMHPGGERFTDALLGEQEQHPAAQCGDLLVRDRLGNWTYQFAVVVDDIRHEIDLVVRGADLIGSTGRQLRLGRLLGRERAPVYLHHPLIHRPDGAKLSKAAGDTGIRELRRAGVRPSSVLGRAAWLTGLLPRTRDLCVGELADLFVTG
jgi:glutamyl/glutaminyl-tRNA synthetase